MRCPFCGGDDTRVIDSRLAAEGRQVRRRRECAACEERFTTFEGAELAMPKVAKADGSRESFDAAKLRRGIEKALYKRPVAAEAVDALIGDIEHELMTLGEREVSAQLVGERVMQKLLTLDQVAFVRFASVYRRFEDVEAFRQEIEALQREPTPEQRRSQLPLNIADDEDAS